MRSFGLSKPLATPQQLAGNSKLCAYVDTWKGYCWLILLNDDGYNDGYGCDAYLRGNDA